MCGAPQLDALKRSPMHKIVSGTCPTWYAEEKKMEGVTTPPAAIAKGAHFLVMGDPILLARCGREEAIKRTLEEIKAG